MTAAPTTQPISSATCWRQGVAPTSQPVLRSCRLSFEMEATATTAEVVKIARAMPICSPCGVASRPSPRWMASMSSDTSTIATMPTPEIGLVDEPISPAM
ncbi:Uncharacterised protein [Bordetella pertussis]|nr:Uncharacterised protein [Bordetella pertussis]CFL81641.1 Uncharacterised protein [Bordetella pertussis]CFL96439.1 Uncharacterised protein [Bordetella pertussis]CFM03236.1 Uncharacterised protein [Bordetella pertussis]CFM48796.1 Uncharacterised protein [Bordetella pertussis]